MSNAAAVIELDHDDPVLKIGMMAALGGCSPATIRLYVRNKLLVPDSVRGGEPYFRPSTVNKLMEIRRKLRQGLTMKDLQKQMPA